MPELYGERIKFEERGPIADYSFSTTEFPFVPYPFMEYFNKRPLEMKGMKTVGWGYSLLNKRNHDSHIEDLDNRTIRKGVPICKSKEQNSN